MGEHSRFSPSAGDRDTLCPPSFFLNENAPDEQTYDSAHGSAAHHVGYLCGANNHDASFYAGCIVAVTDKGECRFVHENAPKLPNEYAFEVDDEMDTNVQAYVDWCRELPGDHFWEVRVEHTPWCPPEDEHGFPLGPQFGTSDHIACEPGVLTVTDLKYGQGVRVFAKWNKQATKYALGAWLKYNWIYDFRKVVIRIAQPRLDHYDVWETTIDELLWFGEEIKRELGEVFNPDAQFNPGEKQCKFCKVNGRCRPFRDYVHSTRGTGFEDETKMKFVDVELLDNDELEQAWRMIPMMKLRIEAISKAVARAMRHGEEFFGLKVVEAVTHRRWKDEAEVRAMLRSLGVPREKIVKEKVISPNQAEKILPKELHVKIKDLWEKPPGGPAVVDVGDKRDAFAGDFGHGGFEDETIVDGFD